VLIRTDVGGRPRELRAEVPESPLRPPRRNLCSKSAWLAFFMAATPRVSFVVSRPTEPSRSELLQTQGCFSPLRFPDTHNPNAGTAAGPGVTTLLSCRTVQQDQTSFCDLALSPSEEALCVRVHSAAAKSSGTCRLYNRPQLLHMTAYRIDLSDDSDPKTSDVEAAMVKLFQSKESAGDWRHCLSPDHDIPSWTARVPS
jgi:hypothetical protein